MSAEAVASSTISPGSSGGTAQSASSSSNSATRLFGSFGTFVSASAVVLFIIVAGGGS